MWMPLPVLVKVTVIWDLEQLLPTLSNHPVEATSTNLIALSIFQQKPQGHESSAFNGITFHDTSKIINPKP